MNELYFVQELISFGPTLFGGLVIHNKVSYLYEMSIEVLPYQLVCKVVAYIGSDG